LKWTSVMRTCSQNKRNLTSNILLGVFAITWFGVGLYWISSQPKHEVVVYNCELSEISPDFPIEAKERCRVLRAQNGRF
jgi:hypothetical protein